MAGDGDEVATLAGQAAPANGRASSSSGGDALGGGERKTTKKYKRRVRGEKARIRTVLRDDDRPAEVRLKGGQTRELNVKAKPSAEYAMPRRMRSLLMAKKALHAKDFAKVAAKAPCRVSSVTQTTATVPLAAVPMKPDVPEKRQTTRQIVIDQVRKHSHQQEKKRSYYQKKADRAEAKKARQKRRRERKDVESDWTSEDEDDEGGNGEVYSRDDVDATPRAKRVRRSEPSSIPAAPRFGEQGLAPPKVTIPVKKHRGPVQIDH
jgi:hypothetical protein